MTTESVDTTSSDDGNSSSGEGPSELPPDMLRFNGADFGIAINALAPGGSGLLAAGNVRVANPSNRDPVLIDFASDGATLWRLGTVGSNEQGWAVAGKPSGAVLVGLARDSANNVDGAMLTVTNANFEPTASWRQTESGGRSLQARAVIPLTDGWLIAGHVGGQSIYVERVNNEGEPIDAVEFEFDLETVDLFPLRLGQDANGRIAVLVQAEGPGEFSSLVLLLDGNDDLSPMGTSLLTVPGGDVRMSDIHSTTSGWVLAGGVASEGAVVELADTLGVEMASTFSLPRLGAVRVRGTTVWIAGGGEGSAMAGVVTPQGARVIEAPLDAPPVFLPTAAVAGLDNLAVAGDNGGVPAIVFVGESVNAACQMQPWGASVDSVSSKLVLVEEGVEVTATPLVINRATLPVPTRSTMLTASDVCL